MHLTVDRAEFLKALGHAQSVVEKRNTVPILSHVLLQAKDQELLLMATDLDLSVVEFLGATVTTPGATTVPALRLYEIVRRLPDTTITLQSDAEQKTLNITAGASSFNLSCLAPEDFPKFSSLELPIKFLLKTSDLKQLLDRTYFAMSTEEARYYLNGIYFHLVTKSTSENGEKYTVLRSVASDAHRLALAEIRAPENIHDMPGVILSRKTVMELRQLLTTSEETVTIQLSETQIQFNFNKIELNARLIDGTFPNYDAVIPNPTEQFITIPTKQFADSVTRISTILSDKTRGLKLKITKDRLIFSATNPDYGHAIDELAIETPIDSLEIGFNARYLTDITNQITSENMIVALESTTAPTVFKSETEPHILYVLMPMRV